MRGPEYPPQGLLHSTLFSNTTTTIITTITTTTNVIIVNNNNINPLGVLFVDVVKGELLWLICSAFCKF